MHIHYHLQCPIYMICDVFGFGHKFLGHYESQLDNFMVEGMCWDDCLYNSFVIGIFAALKKDFSVWMLSSKSIWFFESSVVSMSCHRNRGSLHGKNKKETIKGIDPILVSYYKILSQKKKKKTGSWQFWWEQGSMWILVSHHKDWQSHLVKSYISKMLQNFIANSSVARNIRHRYVAASLWGPNTHSSLWSTSRPTGVSS